MQNFRAKHLNNIVLKVTKKPVLVVDIPGFCKVDMKDVGHNGNRTTRDLP